MQPLILLGLVGVAAVALGAGSLTNVIDLTVQEFGVGDKTIDSPTDSASVDFHIDQVKTNGVFYNVVDLCTIVAADDLGQGSLVFCKLTDSDGDIVAEGHKTVTPGTLTAGDGITIPVTQLADPNQPSNDVRNIHDVTVVIQAP